MATRSFTGCLTFGDCERPDGPGCFWEARTFHVRAATPTWGDVIIGGKLFYPEVGQYRGTRLRILDCGPIASVTVTVTNLAMENVAGWPVGSSFTYTEEFDFYTPSARRTGDPWPDNLGVFQPWSSNLSWSDRALRCGALPITPFGENVYDIGGTHQTLFATQLSGAGRYLIEQFNTDVMEVIVTASSHPYTPDRELTAYLSAYNIAGQAPYTECVSAPGAPFTGRQVSCNLIAGLGFATSVSHALNPLFVEDPNNGRNIIMAGKAMYTTSKGYRLGQNDPLRYTDNSEPFNGFVLQPSAPRNDTTKTLWLECCSPQDPVTLTCETPSKYP